MVPSLIVCQDKLSVFCTCNQYVDRLPALVLAISPHCEHTLQIAHVLPKCFLLLTVPCACAVSPKL